MDVLTHFIVPFAAALFAFGLAQGRSALDVKTRIHRTGLALAFGLAGFAPDLDAIYTALKALPGLWWLQHRGVSHSLFGAPLHAYALLGLGHLLAVRFPRRFGLLVWRRGFFTVGLLGSWTHLLLDGVTLAGVPALFPFAPGRWTLSLFGWLVFWLFPVTAVYLGLWAWKRWDAAWTARFGAVVVVVLVVLAGVRIHYKPEVPEGGFVAGTDDPRTWVVLCPFDAGGSGWDGFVPGYPCTHAVPAEAHVGYEAWQISSSWTGPVEPRLIGIYRGTADADAETIERVRASGDHAGFMMGVFGPVVYTVEPRGDHVRVLTMDVLQVALVDAELVDWTPAKPMDTWGRMVVEVDEGGAVRLVQRGW